MRCHDVNTVKLLDLSTDVAANIQMETIKVTTKETQ